MSEARESELNLADLAARFSDPDAAAEFLESVRWPTGPVCPHCGEHERAPYRLKGKSTRRRLWKCRNSECRKQFTVTVGTIFESSHISLDKWLLAFYLLCSSKKGMSAHQLHRSLGVTYKTAWFMFHRIREAMRDPAFQGRLSGTVEVDETYVGGRERRTPRERYEGVKPGGRTTKKKTPVVALVQRGGQVRSFRAANVTAETLKGAVREHVERDATIMTDDFGSNRGLSSEFARHATVAHSAGEYVRDDRHTNTVEGFFAILKRGVNGTYHHISRAHMDRYLSEFDFRYNTREASDGRRMVKALERAEGKRLTYRETR